MLTEKYVILHQKVYMRYLENKKSKRGLFCGTRTCNGKHTIYFFGLMVHFHIQISTNLLY